ncbi:hypothetical protein [Umezawaea tangerina]|uniref:Uncharacterized protein n=1 Tax=Umezawaea tangerina TaxID=84725 RepID=A0A2T0TFU7_9PSEU|nr:hypothetical protein [Umezawaea tangerina]PRY44519.1 hypothetical protein CLV43_10284 [Umezawaea tangerina]
MVDRAAEGTCDAVPPPPGGTTAGTATGGGHAPSVSTSRGEVDGVPVVAGAGREAVGG